MNRYCLVILIYLSFIICLNFTSADELNGDGNYLVKAGDIIIINNGWKVEILGIFMAHWGEEIQFRIYSPEGIAYPEPPYSDTLNKVDGQKEIGDMRKLQIAIELFELSGSTSPTDSPFVTKYEQANINVYSINKDLPGTISNEESNTPIQVNKDKLNYDRGAIKNLALGENVTFANGWGLNFISLGRFGPSFDIYNEEGELVDNLQLAKFDDETGREVGVFVGSYVHVIDFKEDSVDLLIINASKIIFGTGWNLFSIPIEDGDGYGRIIESSCNNATLWIWNNQAEDYEPIGFLQEGERIPAGKGIFVKIKTKENGIFDNDCQILVSGNKSVTTEEMILRSGWNLIGSPMSAYGKRSHNSEGGSDFSLNNFNAIAQECRVNQGPYQFIATNIVQNYQPQDISDKNKYSNSKDNTIRINRGYFVNIASYCSLTDTIKPCDLSRYYCRSVTMNGDITDKLDLVFVPVNYTDLKNFQDDMDKSLEKGLFNTEPFKSNKDKFNVYAIDSLCLKNDYRLIEKVLKSSCPSVDEIIAIVDDPEGIRKIQETGEGGMLAGYATVDYSLKYPDTIGLAVVGRYQLIWPEAAIYTVSHEFGHSFGLLCDEYLTSPELPLDSLKEEKIECANCAVNPSDSPDIACPKWESIAGAGCYKGCFSPNLYRSSQRSIMGGEGTGNDKEFNSVSLIALQNKLSKYK